MTRADGKLVNVARKPGHLFVCANGCCCGHTEHGFSAVPVERFHTEWERRKLRPQVHLSIGGCLGPCPLANVVMLLFDGHSTWFHSFNSERLVDALYDYVETLVAAQAYFPPPPELAELQFTAFDWEMESRAASPGSRERTGFVFLTHADTDVLAISRAAQRLGPDFPPVRAHSIAHLRSEEDARAFVDRVAPDADVVVLRLLGGRESFRGGFERVVQRASEDDQWLICLPGTETLDPELTAASNVGAPVAHEAFAYLQFGGPKNVEHLLRFLSDHLLATGFGYDAPEPQPRHGRYDRSRESGAPTDSPQPPTIGVLFYRSHLLSGNTAFVDEIIAACEARGARAIAVYTASLQDYTVEDGTPAEPASLPTALRYFVGADGQPLVDCIIATTSFAAGERPLAGDLPFEQLGVPVLQAIASSARREQWLESGRGIPPVDTAINVVIPEIDGRIDAVPISFKSAATSAPSSNSESAPDPLYVPDRERIGRVVGMALRLIALRTRPNRNQRVAFLLSNYNGRASRVAAAVGLDAPASLLRILKAMREAGFDVGDLPGSGDDLLHTLIERGSYDPESAPPPHHARASVDAATYRAWLGSLPEPNRAAMEARWGSPPGRYYRDGDGNLALAGIELGNVFVAIQPPRGFGMDPAAIYHTPDLPPPHPYFALYRWLAEPPESGGWGADAVVHLGKHGTVEWLPGKGVGLSSECYPDLFLGDLPVVYPFIINDPGEGAQAKRRAHAVIVDHLTPPMTTAEGYGEVEELTRLVDEYYQLEQLDPSKLPLLQQQIWELITRARLDADLAALLNRDASAHTHEWDPQAHPDGVPYTISDLGARDFAHLVENMNGYLCELTTAQIRDGLHVFGQAPEGDQLVDTLASLVRLPNLDVPSLRAGVAAHFGLNLDAILDDLGGKPDSPPRALEWAVGRPLPSHRHLLDAMDEVGRRLLSELADREFDGSAISEVLDAVLRTSQRERHSALNSTLKFVCERVAPDLRQTRDEITSLIDALEGRYVRPGPSGAPTRGMAQVLPTGRNFYTVDPRGLPTAAAWTVGQRLAEELLARYLADEGGYPDTVGISIWGTSLIRTHGDDVAEVLALLGVRPRWQPESRRLTGFEAIPLEELGRPRVDVVCRISGFFRDAFPDLISLLDEAIRAVAELDEPLDRNPVRRHVEARRAELAAAGLGPEEAARVSTYRIFGSPPGAYGAGILHLIDERNWQNDADLAEVYVNWGGWAYGAGGEGVDARAHFRAALAGVQAAVKNQDNREHDIFDSDDYFQYHGGMVAAIRSLAGANPRRYFGDSADPQRAKVRDLKEEALRVFRSRVLNPKWITSVQRHGYKGGLELAATVDYVFGYDATAGVVDDWMYERLARAYALDPGVLSFLRRSNPWALRDIAARLAEAMDRGLWSAPPPEMRFQLEAAYLMAEADVESRHVPGHLLPC